LKSIATGEYRAEEAKSEMISEGGPVEPVESDENAADNVPAGETESAPAENEAESKPEENPVESESESKSE